MAGTVAKNSVFKLGTAGTPGTASDISTKVDSVKLGRSVDSHDATAFQGSGAKSFLSGLTNGTIQVSVIYDAAIDAQINALLGVDNVAFELGPQGSTTGQVKYTGNCFVTKWDPPAAVGTLIKATFELQITGAVTATVY